MNPRRENAGRPAINPVTEENPGLLSVLHRFLSPGDVFLDIGANVGVFAIDIALHLGRRGKVHAFEPAADAARELEKNAHRAGVSDRVDIFRIALGSKTELRTLHADPRDPLDWSKRSLFSAGPVVGEVIVRAFDDLVEAKEIVLPNGLHAVKIDVEGAEAEVLHGMVRTMRELRPRIAVVETMQDHQQRAGSSVENIDAVLSDLGYMPLPADSEVPSFFYNTVYVAREQLSSSRR